MLHKESSRVTQISPLPPPPQYVLLTFAQVMRFTARVRERRSGDAAAKCSPRSRAENMGSGVMQPLRSLTPVGLSCICLRASKSSLLKPKLSAKWTVNQPSAQLKRLNEMTETVFGKDAEILIGKRAFWFKADWTSLPVNIRSTPSTGLMFSGAWKSSDFKVFRSVIVSRWILFVIYSHTTHIKRWTLWPPSDCR